MLLGVAAGGQHQRVGKGAGCLGAREWARCAELDRSRDSDGASVGIIRVRTPSAGPHSKACFFTTASTSGRLESWRTGESPFSGGLEAFPADVGCFECCLKSTRRSIRRARRLTRLLDARQPAN